MGFPLGAWRIKHSATLLGILTGLNVAVLTQDEC